LLGFEIDSTGTPLFTVTLIAEVDWQFRELVPIIE
jgi:hypothetical protein